MLIAQISDLHIKPAGKLAYKIVDTSPYLVRAVAWLNALEPHPDVVLATGDLVDGGTAEEYARLKEMLRPLHAPVYLIPGNHDNRETLRAAFSDHSYLPTGEFLHYVVDRFPVRLIGLDTIVPGKETGLLCRQRLEWLDQRLREQPTQPTVIFMHHPPFLTGLTRMDELGITQGAPEMAEIVRRHPQVEHVLCGHVHRPIQVRWAGTVASIAPSTAHQVTLNLAPGGAHTFTLDPPAIQLLLWKPGAGLIGHLGYPDTFPGPYPFRDASGALM